MAKTYWKTLAVIAVSLGVSLSAAAKDHGRAAHNSGWHGQDRGWRVQRVADRDHDHDGRRDRVRRDRDRDHDRDRDGDRDRRYARHENRGRHKGWERGHRYAYGHDRRPPTARTQPAGNKPWVMQPHPSTATAPAPNKGKHMPWVMQPHPKQ